MDAVAGLIMGFFVGAGFAAVIFDWSRRKEWERMIRRMTGG